MTKIAATIVHQVGALLADRGETRVQDIAAVLRLSSAHASSACQRLVAIDKARRVRHGVYAWGAAPKPSAIAPVQGAVALAAQARSPLLPRTKGRVVGQTFREFEVIAGDEIFKTLLRGGDVRVLLASEGGRSIIRKFQAMRASAAEQPESAPSSEAAPLLSPAEGGHTPPASGADLQPQAGG